VSTARLRIDQHVLRDLLAELARRGQGRRESGAFLLTNRDHRADLLPQPITDTVLYDDLDPACLTGGITFHASGYTALNAHCRRNGLRVVADIHTHPGQWVGQSRIDATHPMAALDGHVALIAPRYGAGVSGITELGVHLRVNGTWISYYGANTAAILEVEHGKPASETWWQRIWSWLRRHATPWRRHRSGR
jgi:hypothetical protein